MPLTPAIQHDPGEWSLVEWALIPGIGAVGCSPSEDDEALIMAAATYMVWVLSGRQFGVRSATLRPCLRCGCSSPGMCGCTFYDSIDLDDSGGRRPVVSVESVSIDGVELDLNADVMVVNNRWLIRVPSGERFPVCQDIGADPAPIEVGWTWGFPPTVDLLLNAVYPLVVALGQASCGVDCGLDPSVVQSVQREGVSFALISPGQAWEFGGTGINRIDAACRRAWPLGAAVTAPPGFSAPEDLVRGPDWVRAEFPGV